MPKKEYYTGIVRDNEDPEMRGRLVVECPEVVHGENMAGWIEPTFHFVDSAQQAGAIWIPNIDAVVTVEIEAEEESEVTSLEPKWRCDVYPDDSVPDVFRTNYPQRRGWVTAAGHVMYFDDTDGSLEFLYQHPSGAEIFITNDGRIELKAASGQAVWVGANADESMVLGDQLLSYLQSHISTFYNQHIHPDPLSGNTGIPTVQEVPPTNAILSSLHKVKS